MSELRLAPAEFLAASDRVVQLCARYMESLDQLPSFPTNVSGEKTTELFSGPAPEQGMGAAALEGLKDVFDHSRAPGPRFFAYVFGSGNPVAAVGDLAASVLNQNVTAWRSAPTAVALERQVVGWLAEAIGCSGFTGSLCGGGSSANLMGLAMAREAKVPANETGVRGGVVYASSEVHMSIAKAVGLLGLGRQNIRFVPVNSEFQIDTRALARAMDEDLAAGKKPMAVVASAGTTNTGAIDPLAEVADIAHRRGAWFHVDGAYGALAAIAVPERFAGLDQADSLSLDPHKWLYQPADCGCLLFKDGGWARVAFSHSGEYARPLSDDPVEGFAFFEESMELSRRFRALKLWLSLRYHGLDAFRAAIRRDLDHAALLCSLIEREPSLELLASGPLSAVCFRYAGEGDHRLDPQLIDQFNERLLRTVIHERRRVFISNTSVRGCFALRACFVNHLSSTTDVEEIVREVLEAAKVLQEES